MGRKILRLSFLRTKPIVGVLAIVIIMVLSTMAAVGNYEGSSTNVNLAKLGTNLANELNRMRAVMVPVPFPSGSVSDNASQPYNGQVSVMVTFSFQNQSRLNSLLENLSNPQSPDYHHYLTRSQFASEFSISPNQYRNAVNYFEQFSNLNVHTYADRVSVGISGPAMDIGNALNTSFKSTSSGSGVYYATSSPDLPQVLAAHVSSVTGLTDQKIPVSSNLFISQVHLPQKVTANVDGGYPAPVGSGSVQEIWGSDLQVAYDEQTLLNITYPTNEVIATILWAGNNANGTSVGPFDPSDIYAYYNATLPSYEPHSKVYGVPLNGAVKPGVPANYDVTGANVENTLDLEMVGSTAPGSSIYNVYGPNGTMENIDSALAFILNPNSTYSALNNVSVITNSWGTAEFNNTVWYQYMQEAQARGISVLASSGDSGDNNASSKYTGAQLEFPAAMAYNSFGVTAVGGTTLTLTQNLHILNQTAWYISSSDSADGGPAGSVGGISTVFKEPDFQLNTEANSVLHGAGRGVPDISAVANNTIIYITINGALESEYMWGTSIASPVEAGIVAEMDAVLNHYNQSNLGYLNPLIYGLANKQVSTPRITETTGYISTGDYNSSLPTLPFYNVLYGRNHVYNATYGYNLVTGWGSIDAYNATMYMLNINRSLDPNALRGVEDVLNLKGLNVTSYFYNSTTNEYSIVNSFYNASIQQNLFLANQFGAPIYWIQNVIYINGSQETGWVVNYTGWVVYPFYGQYPSLTLYEYNFPLGKIISMPHTFDVKTWISNISRPMEQTVNFEVNSQVLSLPVPGAAYIIDASNYSYIWQGESYYNGPFPDNPLPGGLDPQFGLVGGPSGGNGIFAKPTSGTITAYSQPMDLNRYIPTPTGTFNESVDETGESASFLDFSPINESSWTISVNNASELQGIVDFAPSQYYQNFTETGLPVGTEWSISISGSEYTTTSSSIDIPLPNGSYTAQVSSPTGYFPTPSEWLFTVQGSPAYFSIAYAYSSNETYLKLVGTLYPVNNQTLAGGVFNNSYTFYNASFGMAYDTSSGLVFIPEFSEVSDRSTIYIYNTSSGQFVKTIPGLGSYDVLYNQNTRMVYSMSVSGNLTEINPSTMSVVKNLTLTNSMDNLTLLQQQGTNIYAFSSNGNISIINASTLSLTRTIHVGGENYISPLFTIYGQNALFANTSGNDIVIVNLTTSSVKQVYLPQDYTPVSVLNYYGSTLLIGGENYTDQVYNVSSGALSHIQRISQTAYSAAYDSFSNMVYIASSPYSGSGFGNVTVMNPASGTIVATIPSVGTQLGMFFDPINQNIYTVTNEQGIIFEYSAQHYYKATFTESGLSSGTTWYVNGTGMSGHDSSPANITFTLTNGTYTFTVTNLSSYYTTTSQFTVHVNGNNVTETVQYYHWAYITGILSPGNAALTVNGNPVSVSSSGYFNVSVANGTYHVVASENGYSTYYNNFTLNNGELKNLTIDLKSVPKSSPISSTEIYAIIGVVAAIAVVAGVIGYMRRRH